jgi:hypothetical protein
MALVSAGWSLSVTLLDNSGNDTTVNYQLRAASATLATTAAGVILTALGAVTGGAIGSYRLTETFVENSISFPTAAFQAEVSASITSLVADEGNKKANYRIPMPIAAVFVSTIGTGANLVNTANAAVLAYHALFASGGQAFLSDGEDAGGLLGGVRVTRSRRGG